MYLQGHFHFALCTRIASHRIVLIVLCRILDGGVA